MKILALENSTAQGSVAFLDGKKDPLVLEYRNDRKNSGPFFEALESLSEHFSKLDTIVVGLGPGSYAGVRIAIATAIGLRTAAGARVLGRTSISAIDPAPNEYCVIGDARRDSFFFARISANEMGEGIRLFDDANLRACLKNLDPAIPVYSSEKLSQFPQTILRYPSALTLAKLAQRGVVHAPETPLEPIYLREPHITIPNDKRNVSMLG